TTFSETCLVTFFGRMFALRRATSTFTSHAYTTAGGGGVSRSLVQALGNNFGLSSVSLRSYHRPAWRPTQKSLFDPAETSYSSTVAASRKSYLLYGAA